MSEERKKDIWFPAKRYGWGWGLPITWQGWVVMLLWFAAVTGGSLWLVREPPGSGLFILFVVLMSVVLVAICWIKGERPRWRWGDDDKGEGDA